MHLRALSVAVLLLAGCKVATVRPLDPVTGRAIVEDEKRAFDARTFVAENWETRVLPAAEKGVPLVMLVRALAADSAGASARYGNRNGGGYSYLVTGTARILSVDTASRAGVAMLDLEPYDGVADARLQVGPVFRGTALRDALPFIHFDDFTNQMEYAGVSRLLHERVRETVVGPIGASALPGKVVRFRGAFTRAAGLPLITPVALEIAE
jgi:predicted lipoprotein